MIHLLAPTAWIATIAGASSAAPARNSIRARVTPAWSWDTGSDNARMDGCIAAAPRDP